MSWRQVFAFETYEPPMAMRARNGDELEELMRPYSVWESVKTKKTFRVGESYKFVHVLDTTPPRIEIMGATTTDPDSYLNTDPQYDASGYSIISLYGEDFPFKLISVDYRYSHPPTQASIDMLSFEIGPEIPSGMVMVSWNQEPIEGVKSPNSRNGRMNLQIYLADPAVDTDSFLLHNVEVLRNKAWYITGFIKPEQIESLADIVGEHNLKVHK